MIESLIGVGLIGCVIISGVWLYGCAVPALCFVLIWLVFAPIVIWFCQNSLIRFDLNDISSAYLGVALVLGLNAFGVVLYYLIDEETNFRPFKPFIKKLMFRAIANEILKKI